MTKKTKLIDEKLATQASEELAKLNDIGIVAIRLKIEASFTKKLSMGAVHNLIRRLGFAYITARPSHYKKDVSSHEEFKKKSTDKV